MSVHDVDALSTIFAQLLQSYTDRVKQLKEFAVLRTADANASCVQMLLQLHTHLQQIEMQMQELKVHVKRERGFLDKARELKEKIRVQAEVATALQATLPQLDIPLAQPPQQTTISASEPAISEQPHNTRAPTSTTSSQLPNKPTEEERKPPGHTTAPLSKSKKKRPAVPPTISYITAEDLTDVPKYMKGHLSVDKINSAVDELNQLLSAKYKILSVPMSKLGGTNLQKYKEYKDQETKDTEGLFFFSEHDLKTNQFAKLDTSGKGIFQVLCHLGRISAISGSMKRWSVCTR